MQHRNLLSPLDSTQLASASSIQALPKKKPVIRSLFSWVSVILVTFAVIYSSIPASASSSGISGFSGKNGSTCTSCHSMGTPPTVTLTGPTTVASGSTNSYTLTVGGTGNHGLDVAASAGTFTAGTGTKVLNGEITQTTPSTTGSWTFTWTAPTVTTNSTATLWAAAVNGFGGGTGTIQQAIAVTAPVPNPTLNVSPASLAFAFTTGGSTPPSQTIAVSSSGSALTYGVSASTTTGGSWLTATGSGTTPGNVTVSLNPGSLAAGTYSGTVSISSSGASNSPKTVSVTLTVTAAPTLNTSPASLSFSYQAGGTTPAAQVVNLSSSGTALSYTTATSATWLLATPASGSTPGSLSVSVNPSGLAAGTYTGNVTVTSAGASNTPKTVPVTLTVTAAPTLNTSPASLSFSYQAGGTTPAAQAVNLSSSGTALSYTTATSATWLLATPASGSTPGSLSVSVNPSGLAAGTYTGNVTVTSAGASNNPKAIPVTLTVTAASLPSMTASPLSLSFSYQSGGATPAAQNVSLSSSGSALSYAAASSAAWLMVTPASGNTPGSLSVSVNPTGLAAGTYTGNVTVTSSGASNSPQKITVTLGVTGTPPSGMSLNITPGSLSFSYLSGSTAPGTQNLSIASSGTALQFTATASGGRWLTISPATGPTPTTMKVSANPTGLAVGTYNGTITITSSGASNSPQTVPVRLVVTSTTSGRLRVWPPRAVTFEYDSGQASPAPRSIRVLSRGAPLSFTAAAYGGTWLSVTPSGGTTPGTLSISVDPTGMTSGTYSGTIHVAAPGSTAVTVPIILTVTSSAVGESEDGSGGVSETDLRASPYAYDPAGTNSVAASWVDATGASSTSLADPLVQGLLLSKTSAASVQAQAVVVIRNAEGITLTELGYDIRNGGQCTAKSPRFVVVTSDDVVHKIGCSTGTAQPSPATGWKRLRFDPSNPAQTAPAITPESKVKSIHIVLDDGPETGASMVVLDNIDVNGTFIGNQ